MVDKPPGKPVVKAKAVREYITNHRKAKNKAVVDALAKQGVTTDPGYVSQIRSGMKKKKKKKSVAGNSYKKGPAKTAKYPRHPLKKTLRLPRAILDQNAGKECSESALAGFVGVGFGGPFRLEISSALKYGILERPSAGRVGNTALAKRILKPQKPC